MVAKRASSRAVAAAAPCLFSAATPPSLPLQAVSRCKAGTERQPAVLGGLRAVAHVAPLADGLRIREHLGRRTGDEARGDGRLGSHGLGHRRQHGAPDLARHVGSDRTPLRLEHEADGDLAAQLALHAVQVDRLVLELGTDGRDLDVGELPVLAAFLGHRHQLRRAGVPARGHADAECDVQLARAELAFELRVDLDAGVLVVLVDLSEDQVLQLLQVDLDLLRWRELALVERDTDHVGALHHAGFAVVLELQLTFDLQLLDLDVLELLADLDRQRDRDLHRCSRRPLRVGGRRRLRGRGWAVRCRLVDPAGRARHEGGDFLLVDIPVGPACATVLDHLQLAQFRRRGEQAGLRRQQSQFGEQGSHGASS